MFMNSVKRLEQARAEYFLIHQQRPLILRCTPDVRADLERNNAIPEDMEVVNVDSPVSVLRVE